MNIETDQTRPDGRELEVNLEDLFTKKYGDQVRKELKTFLANFNWRQSLVAAGFADTSQYTDDFIADIFEQIETDFIHNFFSS